MSIQNYTKLVISELTEESLALVPKNEVKKLIIDDGLNNISLISEFKNLEELIINKSAISDITPLSNLRKLKKLSINNSLITDISPINKLYNLKSINFTGNKLESINLDKFNSNQMKANFIKCSDSINIMTDLQQFKKDKDYKFKSKFLTKTMYLFDEYKNALLSSQLTIGSYLCEQIINYYTNLFNRYHNKMKIIDLNPSTLCEILIKYKGNYDKIKINNDEFLINLLKIYNEEGYVKFSSALLESNFLLNECIYEINASIKDTYNFSNYKENRKDHEDYEVNEDYKDNEVNEEHEEHEVHEVHEDYKDNEVHKVNEDNKEEINSLNELILDNNEFESIDKSINCENITILSMNHNKIKNNMYGLKYLKKLKSISVNHNLISDMGDIDYYTQTQYSLSLIEIDQLRYMLCITLLYEMSHNFKEENFKLEMITF